jgi:chromosome segregation ATPase
MNQEKFVGVYIDLLNSTLSEAIQKNIVAQAQNKVNENDLSELQKSFNEMQQEKDARIRGLVEEINGTRRQIGQLTTQIEQNKTSSEHFETYKNELVNCRKKNEDLIALIEQKDKLIADKDKQLQKFNAGPKPVVVNKLGKKNTPVVQPLETKEENVEQTSKTIKVKSVRDAGNF